MRYVIAYHYHGTVETLSDTDGPELPRLATIRDMVSDAVRGFAEPVDVSGLIRVDGQVWELPIASNDSGDEYISVHAV